METTVRRIAGELGVREDQIEAVLRLLSEGATVPFLARYRKEATGGLALAHLRAVEDRLQQVRELDERRAFILKAVGEQGRLKGIEVVKTRLGEFDASGRRKPVSTEEIQGFKCDTVILAIGERVDPDFARAAVLNATKTGTIEVDRFTLQTSRTKFYAGGDLISGASNVSNAMGYGKKAARNIDAFLRGSTYEPWKNSRVAEFEKLNPWYYSDAPKTVQPVLDAIRRRNSCTRPVRRIRLPHRRLGAKRLLRAPGVPRLEGMGIVPTASR